MPARCRNDRYRDQPAGFRTIAEGALRPRSCRLEFGLASRPRTGDRPAESTAERSKVIAVGRGGECNEHTRPAVPPPTSVRPRSGRIVSPRDTVRRRRCRARPRAACHSGNNATAPRSARSGWRYRGSPEGSLHSPPCDPRLFPSTAPRSRNRPVCGRIDWSAVGVRYRAGLRKSRLHPTRACRSGNPAGVQCEIGHAPT